MMKSTFTATGKQVLCDGAHYADATNEDAAARIVAALNSSERDRAKKPDGPWPLRRADGRTWADGNPVGKIGRSYEARREAKEQAHG